jgi:hypothetical protein
MVRAASCTFRKVVSAFVTLAGLTSTATQTALGNSSCSSPSRLATTSGPKILKPVALPPGRARLATRPSLTGSSPTPNTIGISVVAALAASAAALLAGVAMTATRRRTKSAISAGRRSYRPSSQWYSTITLWPSTKPVSPRPLRNAAALPAEASADPPLTNPITGSAGWACAGRGHAAAEAAAAPPSPAMNSRRLIRSPRRRAPALAAGFQGPSPSRSSN